MTPSMKAARDTGIMLAIVSALVAVALWAAWHLDFGLSPVTLVRIIAGMILVGWVFLLGLFAVIYWTYRADHHEGRPSSPLHLSMIWSFGALYVHFLIASISAIDVFYKPREAWPLLRDPTVRLIAAAMIFAIIAPRAWLLADILLGRQMRPLQIAALYVGWVAVTLLVIVGVAVL